MIEMDSIESTLLENNAEVQRDPLVTQFGKRLFSIAPIVAMTFSSINQVFTIGRNEAAQSTIRSYNRQIEVLSDGVTSYYTCEYGDATTVVTYCPYIPIAAFKVMLSLWCAYFAMFAFARLAATAAYSTYDLRFHIAVDRYNGHIVNKVFLATGYLLTTISVAVSLYYLSPQTAWNNSIDTESLLSIIVFAGINFTALHGLQRMSTSGQRTVNMSDFPHPIYVHNLGGNVPMFASIDVMLKPLLEGYLLSLTSANDTTILSKYGNSTQLQNVMSKLYHVTTGLK